MFHNVGGKIKGIAFTIFVLGCIGASFSGLMLFMQAASLRRGGGILVLAGLIVTAVGVLIAYLSTIAIYGFGQLIENTDIMVGCLRRMEEKLPKPDAGPKMPAAPVPPAAPVRPAAPAAPVPPAPPAAPVPPATSTTPESSGWGLKPPGDLL